MCNIVKLRQALIRKDDEIMNMVPFRLGLDPKDVLWVLTRPWLWPIAPVVITAIVIRNILDR